MKADFIDPSSYLLSDFKFSLDPKNRYVVFDLEATGPDEKSDHITQIGAVAMTRIGESSHDCFKSLIRPSKEIPEKIEELTGITNKMAADAPELSEVWPDFQKFCKDSILVTQCGYEFDYPLVESECDRLNLPKLEQQKLDTKAIFALMHPNRSGVFSTDYLADYYGIDQSDLRRHDALNDAQLISRIFHMQLKEASELEIKRLHTESPIRIQKAVLPKL